MFLSAVSLCDAPSVVLSAQQSALLFSFMFCSVAYYFCVSAVTRMAEQEPTPEQLAEIAAANEESEAAANYKAPAQKSLQEIQELDKDDESLCRYKEALLGKANVVAGQ